MHQSKAQVGVWLAEVTGISWRPGFYSIVLWIHKPLVRQMFQDLALVDCVCTFFEEEKSATNYDDAYSYI